MVVMKFGGTSVGDPDAIRRMAAIVKREARPRIVVVSALARVTDRLLEVAGIAAEGDAAGARARLQDLHARHRSVAVAVAADRASRELQVRIDAVFARLEQAVDDLAAARAPVPRLIDAVAAQGELLSSRIAVAALQAAGVCAAWIDACDVIATDADHTGATPDLFRTTQNLDRLVRPLLRARQVPVLGGFVGSSADGAPTTLGRGGSDFSAALVGTALGCEEIQIWTDVDGMLTADPRLVPSARPVRHLSYAEAFDLACFGAKVLHPGTVGPAVDQRIPLRILNSRHPELPGTRIDGAPPPRLLPLTALACKDAVAVLEVRSRQRLRAENLLASVLDLVRRFKLTVALAAVSEGGVSLAVETLDALDDIVEALSEIGDVMTHPDLALICLVGEDLRANGHIAAEVLDELRDLGPATIAQPAARCLTLVVPRRHLREGANRLHDRFFGVPGRMMDAAGQVSSAAGL